MKQEGKVWSLGIVLYPGILLGFRTYEQRDYDMHVLYFPFVEFELKIYK
jgi:hypothetical protein